MKVCPQCRSPKSKKFGYTETGVQRFKCSDCDKYYNENTSLEVDEELILDNTRLAKQKQKLQDVNRIERKSFREHARLENALEEYGKALSDLAELHAAKLTKINLPEIKNKNTDRIGVIHITDWHANELIELPHNRYDFTVLSKRAQKLRYIMINDKK